jgi:two-component system NarL family sensor kinase
MQLRLKLILLTGLPLLLAVAAIAAIMVSQSRQLAEEQAAVIEQSLLAARRAELQNYVAMATTAIEHLRGESSGDAENQARAKRILNDMSFGADGYFFVYDQAGNNLVHPRKPDFVGRNHWDLRDPTGFPVIREIIGLTQMGGGFLRYRWEKPSTGQEAEKLGYVVSFDRWGWSLGTGLYLDDIEQATAKIRSDVRANIANTMWKLAAVAVVAALVVFAGGMMLNISEQRAADGKLRALTQKIVSLQEDERARVSRELHDGISQLLVSAKFQFELVQNRLAASPECVEDVTKGLAGLTEAIDEVRRISHDLRPASLSDLGLQAALRQLGERFRQRTGIRLVAEADSLPGELAEDVSVALYRIAQEALTNIERHSGATEAGLALVEEGDQLRLRVSDNGCGFDADGDQEAGEGIGLRNMRERLEHLGGVLSVKSAFGATTIEARIPAAVARRMA